MDQKTVLLILNPISGLSQPEYVRQRFETFFQGEGWATRVYLTTGKEIVADIVRQAVSEGVQMVVAAGGDGTLSATGSGLVGTQVPLGILPTGTWNALARNLGIPLVLDEALKVLTGPHHVLQMDSLEISGRHYLLNVGVGLSAAVIQSTQRMQKRRFGFLAYVWNLLVQVSGLRLRPIRLIVDGKEHKIRASELMVVNSSIIGFGELPTVLDIQPDDGKIEILAIRAPTIFGLVKIVANFLIGRRKRTPGFLTFEAIQHVSIRSRKKFVVQADGEIIGHTPADILIHPGAVMLIVPKRN
jgi:diacylglycerol kinase (ATP)